MLRREVKLTLRVVVQTLFAPVVSSALYIFIFGTVIGSKIDDFAGVPYISFVFTDVVDHKRVICECLVRALFHAVYPRD